MKTLSVAVCLSFVVLVTAPPVTQKKPGDDPEKDSQIKDSLEDYMDYHRYLKEVVAALESDPEFREKLEKADYVDIRSGKIAHELDFVHHNVRTKLDEIKRGELERLRHLATKQFELSNHIDTAHVKISQNAEHLDHNNPHTFEIDDLKKLILKTTKDLEAADKQRRDEFKEYEMQKEFEKQQKLQGLDEDHRKEYEKELHDQEEKHKKHEPLHHPGSRQQLEEVWEKQDHMESQQFDPKVFFMLHDVDGNGVWDQTEVKALFIKELDKMYQNGAPEDDMRERQEEMERMREHVFQESDLNKDGLISYEEFLIQTRRAEFEKDQGWKGLDEQEVYSMQEYEKFERNRLEEVQRLVQQGVLPPQPIYGQGHQYPNPHGNPQHPAYQQQVHPNQYPQQNQQFQQQQYHPNAVPQGQQQYHQNAVPQGQQQYHPNAVPQGQQQYHPNAVPQGQQQYNPNAVPQGQQQYNPNVAPQGQLVSNSGPQGQFQQPQPQQQYQPNNVQNPPSVNQNAPSQGHQNPQQNVQQPQQNVQQPQQNVNVQPQPQLNQNAVPPPKPVSSEQSQNQIHQANNEQPHGENNAHNKVEQRNGVSQHR